MYVASMFALASTRPLTVLYEADFLRNIDIKLHSNRARLRTVQILTANSAQDKLSTHFSATNKGSRTYSPMASTI